jgi:hypothetical protein
MQFIQFLQEGDRRYLQEIELILAGFTKIGYVAMEGGTPICGAAYSSAKRMRTRLLRG